MFKFCFVTFYLKQHFNRPVSEPGLRKYERAMSSTHSAELYARLGLETLEQEIQ